jgi:hypothetical protein
VRCASGEWFSNEEFMAAFWDVCLLFYQAAGATDGYMNDYNTAIGEDPKRVAEFFRQQITDGEFLPPAQPAGANDVGSQVS